MAEQELNEKLVEWAGFAFYPGIPDNPQYGDVWRYPNGDYLPWLPNFTHDLNACFRWIIPLVSGWEMGSTHDGRTAATVWDHKKAKIRRGFDKEAAMALCKAFEELRKEG